MFCLQAFWNEKPDIVIFYIKRTQILVFSAINLRRSFPFTFPPTTYFQTCNKRSLEPSMLCFRVYLSFEKGQKRKPQPSLVHLLRTDPLASLQRRALVQCQQQEARALLVYGTAAQTVFTPLEKSICLWLLNSGRPSSEVREQPRKHSEGSFQHASFPTRFKPDQEVTAEIATLIKLIVKKMKKLRILHAERNYFK